MTNETTITLESLKANFQANIERNEEEGIITGTGDEIIEFLTEKCKEIAKTENCILETSTHEYPLNFSGSGEFIDFQVRVSSNINYEEEVIQIFESNGLYVTYFDFDEENNRSSFTVYTSITV